MHTHADTHICADFQAHADPHLHTDLHTQMCTRTKTHTQACVHKSAQAHIDMCTDTQTPQGPSKNAHDLMHTNVHTLTDSHKDTGADPHILPHTETRSRSPRGDPSQPHRHTCRNAHARTHTIAHTHRLSSQRHTHVLALTDLPSRHAHTCSCLAFPISSSRQRGPGVLLYSSTKDPFPNTSWWIGTDLGQLSQQCHCVSAPAAPLCPLLTPELNVGEGGPRSSREGPLWRGGTDRVTPLVALVLLLRAAPTPHSVNFKGPQAVRSKLLIHL